MVNIIGRKWAHVHYNQSHEILENSDTFHQHSLHWNCMYMHKYKYRTEKFDSMLKIQHKKINKTNN